MDVNINSFNLLFESRPVGSTRKYHVDSYYMQLKVIKTIFYNNNNRKDQTFTICKAQFFYCFMDICH